MFGGPELEIRTPEATAAAISLIVQIATAVVLFSVITGAAVTLQLVTRYCEAHGLLAPWVIQGMQALEFVLWAADVICFLLLMVVEVRKFCIRVWSSREA